MPGRNVIRNGLRKPVATIRFVFASAPAKFFIGLSAGALPVSGSIRAIVPSRPVGSPWVRTSCERSMPPSAVCWSAAGERIAARVDRGRASRRRAAALAPVHAAEAGAVAAGRRSSMPSRSEGQRAARVAGELLAPLAVAAVADQVQPAGRIRDVGGQVDRVAIELAADDAAVGRAPGGLGQLSFPASCQTGAVCPGGALYT